jgi:hypothetical protein
MNAATAAARINGGAVNVSSGNLGGNPFIGMERAGGWG